MKQKIMRYSDWSDMVRYDPETDACEEAICSVCEGAGEIYDEYCVYGDCDACDGTGGFASYIEYRRQAKMDIQRLESLGIDLVEFLGVTKEQFLGMIHF